MDKKEVKTIQLSERLKSLLLPIMALFVLIMAGLIGLLYVRTTKHLMDYDVSINKFTEQNKILQNSNMEQANAIFIGNSITEQWSYYHANFLSENGYLNRGLGGETSPQMLLRFRSDVIDLKPKVVVIGAGINDIAENTGRYYPEFTLNNIKSMAELAQANSIKVVLTSVLPATELNWNHKVDDVVEKIAALNQSIAGYANQKGFEYVDYFTSLVGDDNGLKPEYSVDGVHINAAAYKVMEPLVKQKIDKLIGQIAN